MESFNKFQTRFNDLPVKSDCTIAEYIWIGGSGNDIRSKTMCIPQICSKLEDFPIWNFDGSSTKQAPTSESEILLRPVFLCKDPFRQVEDTEEGKAVTCLVLCEALKNDMTPAKANFRYYASKIFEASADEKPWFGFEQEYILLKNDNTSNISPLSFPKGGFPAPQGQYYCSVGSTNAIGRYVAEAHMRCCLYAGLKVSGINAEVFPGQWEFQIGPVLGLNGCDQLWMARYILQRVCEEFEVNVTFEPKPVKGDWNGSGCHTNFSYESTRKEGGYDKIIEAMVDLTKKHKEHIFVYGEDNDKRLTGAHETAYIEKFNYGIANRGSSARIPTTTVAEKKGYFEDRRPAGNCNPYLVGGMLVDTTILKGKFGDELVEAYKNFLKN
jgi:glutamine synthetase